MEVYWKNKLLSYAERLQLIVSILSAMHVYWASVFVLPKAVIKDIDKLLKGFLWCQGELSKGKAKVAWKLICRPKCEGDLGIKELEKWNAVLMTKHLWNIASNKQTIWARWIQESKLKGCCVWEVKSEKCASRGWKQILNLRDKVQDHVICQVGNGESIFLWHDKWWGPESLSKIIPMEYIDQAGLSHNLKIKDMIKDGQWCWPDNWYSTFPVLSIIPVPTLCPNTDDKYLWCSNNGMIGKYSTNKVWADLRHGGSNVDWADIVWFSNCTPKHAFIMWMAVQGRLSTQERLHKWYPDKIMACPFCEKCLDSLNHLFFECYYSRMIWKCLKDKAGHSSLPDKWDDIC